LLQILLGSLLLSLVHASIPSHWLPLVAVGKAQRWSRGETLSVTALVGAAHVSSTVLIGIFVGLLGYRLSADVTLSSLLPAAVLIGLGILYLVVDRRAGGRHAHYGETPGERRSSTRSIVISLSTAMFFSPCIEIEAYYLKGGALGWQGITGISLVYLLVSVLCMVVLVDLGRAGAEKIRWHYLEHHEKRVTGIVLVVLGLVALIVRT